MQKVHQVWLEDFVIFARKLIKNHTLLTTKLSFKSRNCINLTISATTLNVKQKKQLALVIPIEQKNPFFYSLLLIHP